MTVVIWSRGDLEGTQVYQEFDDIVTLMGRAAQRGAEYVIIEKADTKRVAFTLSNIQRIEELD